MFAIHLSNCDDINLFICILFIYLFEHTLLKQRHMPTWRCVHTTIHIVKLYTQRLYYGASQKYIYSVYTFSLEKGNMRYTSSIRGT